MIVIKIKSLDQNSLMIYKNFLENTLSKLLIRYKVSNIPTTTTKITLLKSPHVNKKAREQFQHKRYKAFFEVKTTLNIRVIKYIVSNKPKTIKIVVSQKETLAEKMNEAADSVPQKSCEDSCIKLKSSLNLPKTTINS